MPYLNEDGLTHVFLRTSSEQTHVTGMVMHSTHILIAYDVGPCISIFMPAV